MQGRYIDSNNDGRDVGVEIRPVYSIYILVWLWVGLTPKSRYPPTRLRH